MSKELPSHDSGVPLWIGVKPDQGRVHPQQLLIGPRFRTWQGTVALQCTDQAVHRAIEGHKIALKDKATDKR